MLYILVGMDAEWQETPEVHVVLEGRPGYSIQAIMEAFQEKLKPPPFTPPWYAGPKPVFAPVPPNLTYSGAFTPISLTSEYETHRAEYNRAYQEYRKTEAAFLESVRLTYPGKDQTEMFCSFAEKEYGLKRVPYDSGVW